MRMFISLVDHCWDLLETGFHAIVISDFPATHCVDTAFNPWWLSCLMLSSAGIIYVNNQAQLRQLCLIYSCHLSKHTHTMRSVEGGEQLWELDCLSFHFVLEWGPLLLFLPWWVLHVIQSVSFGALPSLCSTSHSRVAGVTGTQYHQTWLFTWALGVDRGWQGLSSSTFTCWAALPASAQIIL